jgi:uncharacterized protein YidB (DUF937 family)
MSVFDSIKSVLSGDASPTELMDDLEQIVGDVDLGHLKEQFDAAGLGDKVQSWIGTGDNEPLSADEVKEALDPSQLQAIADKAGVDVDTAAADVAETLPQLVNKLTPDGVLPSAS